MSCFGGASQHTITVPITVEPDDIDPDFDLGNEDDVEPPTVVVTSSMFVCSECGHTG